MKGGPFYLIIGATSSSQTAAVANYVKRRTVAWYKAHSLQILDCVMNNNPSADCYGARFVPTDGMFVRFSFIYAVLARQ